MAGRHDSSSEDEKQEIRGRYGQSSDEDRKKKSERVADSGSESSGREVRRGGEERRVEIDAKRSGGRRDEERRHGRRDLNQGSDSERERRHERRRRVERMSGKGERRGDRRHRDRGVDGEDERPIGRRREKDNVDEDAENDLKGREREMDTRRDSESERLRDRRHRDRGVDGEDDRMIGGRRERDNVDEDTENGLKGREREMDTRRDSEGERRGDRRHRDRGVDGEDDRTIGRRRGRDNVDEDAENGLKGREREMDTQIDSEGEKRRDRRHRDRGVDGEDDRMIGQRRERDNVDEDAENGDKGREREMDTRIDSEGERRRDRRHRDRGVDGEEDWMIGRRRERDNVDEDDENGHKGRERERERETRKDSEVDGRDRRRRNEGRRDDDDDEKRRYRGGEDGHAGYGSKEDNKRKGGRDQRGERERLRAEDVDFDRVRKDKDGRKEESRSMNKKEGDARPNDADKVEKPKEKVGTDTVANLGRSGGVYIPPFKLARMMKDIQDKSSVEYQRMTWDALRKSINGLVNKVNATNLKNIVPELFAENLIRGRGLFCRSCMKSQMASPGFTDVFAGLVAVVNTKFPEVGDLLLRRIILQLQRAFKRNDKPQLLAAVKFIAHLVNQQVVHELIALELLTLLLEKPTDDSVEVAVGFVTECGSMLQDLSPRGLHGIFERLRGILHEGEIDKRVQFIIEGLFALRKAKFQGYPAIRPELDLVENEDQLTHEISLLDEIDPEIALDIFKPDPQFPENEKRYEDLKKQILGEESDDEDNSDAADSDDDDDDGEESEEEDEEQMKINDETETNLINLRRTIYLTIMSSVDFEEAGHKLLKIRLEPGQEMELCIMLLECCSQERTYLRYYGLLGQRFCMINKVHQENFETCFVQQYSMIHRLETNKLRNVAKFFAHLLGTYALPWHVLSYIRLTEEDTSSSSRIFIKILFQELSEHLGIRLLNERLSDPTMQDSFESIFPRDTPKNTRFAINFFTSIGLGGITENLREYLKNMPRLIMQQQKAVPESEDESGSSSTESESSSSSESESESDSDDRRRRKKSRKNK